MHSLIFIFLNLEKMRSTYGKLVYLLQDSVSTEIQELLQFSCKRSIKTVYSVLEKKGGLNLLRDPHIMTATREIVPDKLAFSLPFIVLMFVISISSHTLNFYRNKSRHQIRQEISQKEKAVEYLSRKYASNKLTKETIQTCLYSIGDNNNFLTFNRDPVRLL